MSYCLNFSIGIFFVQIKLKKYKTMITLFKDPFFNGFDNMFEARFIKLPETNISKDEKGYVVSISVPGLTKDDLKISTKEGVLKIIYEKNEGDTERHFIGSFVKSYNIPDDVNEKNIEGKVENGVLTITLPRDKKKSLERMISLN